MTMDEQTKRRLTHIGLVLTSFIGYLEWGADQSMFLIQGEWDIIQQVFTDPAATLHPFIWLPMIGQVLLLVAAFTRKRKPILTWLGISGIGILLYFMFVIGFLGGGWMTSISVLPFMVLSIWVMVDLRRNRG